MSMFDIFSREDAVRHAETQRRGGWGGKAFLKIVDNSFYAML